MTGDKNIYKEISDFLPRGYRIKIKRNTGASISLINKVLRGEVNDTRGIIVEAYKIAGEEIKRRKKLSNEFDSLKLKIDTK